MPRKTKKTEPVEPSGDVVPALPADEPAAAITDAGDAPESVGAVSGPEPDLDAAPESQGEVALAQAVTFTLEGQLYGLPIDVVQEIQQLVELMPVPDSAPWLVGLIDVRGTVIPTIDLRTLLGIPVREYTLETPMVFCRVGGHVVCLIVDAVEDVVDLPAEGLQPPTSLYSMADRMMGMCRLPQGLVLMLDVDRLVPDAALAAADVSKGGE